MKRKIGIFKTLSKHLSEKEALDTIKPVCRELYELVKEGNLHFISGSYNEGNGTYKINLKCSRIHLASRGFKDSIGDIEYEHGKIGLRANGILVNVFVDLI